MDSKTEALSRAPTAGRASKPDVGALGAALPTDRRHPSPEEVKAALAATIRKHGDALERLAKA